MSTIQTSSTYKVDLSQSTIDQRCHFLNMNKQGIRQSHIRDPRSRIDYPLSCFATLLDYHVPTNKEMELSAAGNFHFRNFQNNHFSQNANHLAKAFGFDENTLPHHNVWCDFTQRYRQIPLNSWGNTIDPGNDETLTFMMEEYRKIPRRLLGHAMIKIGEIINSHLVKPVIFNNKQLHAPLMFLQTIQGNLIKACIDQQTQIDDRINLLTRKPIHARATVDNLRDKAKAAVELWEISYLQYPGDKESEYIKKQMTYLRSRDAKFLSEGDRMRMLKQLDKIEATISSAGYISLDQFLDSVSDGFGDTIFSEDASPTSKGEVAFVADCDHPGPGHPKTAKTGATKPNTPFAPKQANAIDQRIPSSYETQILLDIKSEMGQYRKETRELKENVNKLIATSNGKGGKGGWGKKNWEKGPRQGPRWRPQRQETTIRRSCLTEVQEAEDHQSGQAAEGI